MEVQKFEIERDGKIVVIPSEPKAETDNKGADEWGNI